MSLLPTCSVCDALLPGYLGNTRCKQCEKPCEVCGGDVACCLHPLPDRLTKTLGDPMKKRAA